MAEPIVVVAYDPAWPAHFTRLRERVTAALGELVVRVEHIGTTAVPGLLAEPIVDMDVVIPSAADLPAAIARLAALGYVHRGDLGIPGREAFAPPPGVPRHALYVCTLDSAELRRHIAFRDRLRTHHEEAGAYAALKQDLARRFRDDRDAYTTAKRGLGEAILRRAAGGI